MKLEFSVSADENGLTLAAILRKRLAPQDAGADAVEVPWSRARMLCTRGKVTVDGVIALDPATRCKRAQKVSVDERAPKPKPASAAELVFDDPHVVVLDKPSGISSVPYEKREVGTAMDMVRAAWKHAGIKGTSIPLLVVHRIDKETSGLLAFAKSKLAERELQALFRTHDVERTYVCVAHGKVFSRRIESMLVTDRGDGLRGSTRKPKLGKRAVTHVRVLEELPGATLCEVKLETGKTHQIRIHLSEAGHPLVGERVYIRDFSKRGEEPIPAPRLLLHAATLGFRHPVTKELVQLSSPLPPDFTAELAKIRRRRGS
ncbi:MAG TPA: RluA family pseudouridine synthase [Polyangia bacterium]|nr:RluA family pseudouridine synthase [Polyangia bacterium]